MTVRTKLSPPSRYLFAGMATALAMVASTPETALAKAQPGGRAGGMPGQGPGAQGQGQDDDDEGIAESAPRDRNRLAPTRAVPAFPRPYRRLRLFELHGYLRARSDYFHRLSLGHQPVGPNATSTKFAPPASETIETQDNSDTPFATNSAACRARLTAQGAPANRINRCSKREGLSSANMRLRLRPTLNVTETVKVHTMLDLLDNVVLGSTPDSYLGQNPYAPIDLFSRGQTPPSAGLNGFQDSIVVKQAYGEVKFGWGLQLSFGRMPLMWGMGIVYHDGVGRDRGEADDRIRRMDNDYGDAVDSVRLSYDFGKNPEQSHRVTFAYDWAASGPTTDQLMGPGWSSGQRLGQAITVDRHDKVHQFQLSVERRDDMEALNRKLSLDLPVLNYGLSAWLRVQTVDRAIGTPGFGDGLGGDRFELNRLDSQRLSHFGRTVSMGGLDESGDNGRQNYAESLVNRRAMIFTPDFWMRINWRTLRIELEAAAVLGRMFHRDLRSAQTFDPGNATATEKTWLTQFGYALEIKHGVFHDKFTFGMDHGFATGQAARPVGNDLASPWPAVDPRAEHSFGTGRLSTFRFNPGYTNDLILFRELLGTHANAMYFKPWLAYRFLQDKLSVRLDLEYAFANRVLGSLGTKRHYGAEADVALRYHDTHRPFYAQLQYGVLLPMQGLRPRRSGERISPTQTVQIGAGIEF